MRVGRAITAFGAGAAIALNGACAESREVVEPAVGIVLEKYTDDYDVCYSIDLEDQLDCPDLQESTITTYHITIGACALEDGRAILAKREYLESAAADRKNYPIAGEENAVGHQDGRTLDNTKDYACLGEIKVESDVYDKIKEGQLYPQ